MSEGEIETVTELKIFLNGKIDKLDDHLKRMESNLTTRLEKIDNAFAGMGRLALTFNWIVWRIQRVS